MVRAPHMRLALLLCLLFLLAAILPAHADTIVLKNGRRIYGYNVVEENGRVSYETRAGHLSLPKSIVDRIERGGTSAALDPGGDPSVNLALGQSLAPPAIIERSGAYEEVARAAVRNGSVDVEYLAQLENAAQGNRPGSEAVARVAVAHHAAAQFELGRGNLGEAIAHYRRALTFDPDQLGLLLNIAYLHLRRSEYSAATEYLERARRVAPDSADVPKLQGWGYYGQNRLDQAVQEWKRAQSLRPDPDVERALEKAQRDQQAESNFREGDTSHFNLRYHGDAAPQLARDVLRVLEQHFTFIESELDFTPAEPIGVILYTQQAFADITRAPGWVGALNDGRIRVPVQGLTSVSPDLSRILRHELTHSFIQQKTRGRCPVWLQEGVAQWMEGQRSGDNAAVLVEAYDRKLSAPLGALEGSWMNLQDSQAAYAYAWSLAVVEYIVQSNGLRDVSRMLDRIAAGSTAEAAAQEILRMDYSDLEQGTIAYIRQTYLR